MLPKITTKIAAPIQGRQRRNAAVPETCPALCYFPEGQDLNASFQQRHQARSDIESILSKAQSGSDSSEQLTSLAEILKSYRSSHGISSKLITKIYALCIRQFTFNYLNLELVFNLINLITQKFPNKLKPNEVKNKYITQDLEVFLNYIISINTSKILLSQNHNSGLIKKIVKNVMTFHIHLKIFHSGLIAVHEPHGLTRLFCEYKNFCEKQEIFIENSLVPMIHFIERFKQDFHEHVEMMNAAFHFIGFTQTHCQINRPAEFDQLVFKSLDSILSFKHKTRHQIVHDVQLASKFVEHLSESMKGHEIYFLGKINLHIINDKLSEKYLEHDFHDLLKLYVMILHLKKPDDRVPILDDVIEQTKSNKIAYRLLGTILNGGIYLSHDQIKEFLPQLFYDVRFYINSFTNLEKESLYEIMTAFYRMGPAFFTPDLIKIAKDLANQILCVKEPESEEGKFASSVIHELYASFPNTA